MRCPRCGHDNADESKYCGNCNVELPVSGFDDDEQPPQVPTENQTVQIDPANPSSESGTTDNTEALRPGSFRTTIIVLSSLILLLTFTVVTFYLIEKGVFGGGGDSQTRSVTTPDQSQQVITTNTAETGVQPAPCRSNRREPVSADTVVVPPTEYQLTVESDCPLDAVLKNRSTGQSASLSGTELSFGSLAAGRYNLTVSHTESNFKRTYPISIYQDQQFSVPTASIHLDLENLDNREGSLEAHDLMSGDLIEEKDLKQPLEIGCIPLLKSQPTECRIVISVDSSVVDSTITLEAHDQNRTSFTLPRETGKDKPDPGHEPQPVEDDFKFRLEITSNVDQAVVPLDQVSISFAGKVISPGDNGIFTVNRSDGRLKITGNGFRPHEATLSLTDETQVVAVVLECVSGIQVTFQRNFSRNTVFSWRGQRVPEANLEWNQQNRQVLVDVEGTGILTINQPGMQPFRQSCNIPPGSTTPVDYFPCPELVEVGFRTGEQHTCPSLWRTTVRLDFPCDHCDTTFKVLDDLLNIMLCGEEAVVRLSKEGRDTTIGTWDFSLPDYFTFTWPPCEQRLTLEFPNIQFTQQEQQRFTVRSDQQQQQLTWLSANEMLLNELPQPSGYIDVSFDGPGWPLKRRIYFNIDNAQIHSLNEFHRTVFKTSRPVNLRVINSSVKEWVDFSATAGDIEIVTVNHRFTIEVSENGNPLLLGGYSEDSAGRIRIPVYPISSYELIWEAKEVHGQAEYQLSQPPAGGFSVDFLSMLKQQLDEALSKVDKANEDCANECKDCIALRMMLVNLTWQCMSEEEKRKKCLLLLSKVIADRERLTGGQPLYTFSAFYGALSMLMEFTPYLSGSENLEAVEETANIIHTQALDYIQSYPHIGEVEARYIDEAFLAYVNCLVALYRAEHISQNSICTKLNDIRWSGKFTLKQSKLRQCGCVD